MLRLLLVAGLLAALVLAGGFTSRVSAADTILAVTVGYGAGTGDLGEALIDDALVGGARILFEVTEWLFLGGDRA